MNRLVFVTDISVSLLCAKYYIWFHWVWWTIRRHAKMPAGSVCYFLVPGQKLHSVSGADVPPFWLRGLKHGGLLLLLLSALFTMIPQLFCLQLSNRGHTIISVVVFGCSLVVHPFARRIWTAVFQIHFITSAALLLTRPTNGLWHVGIKQPFKLPRRT